MHETPDAPDESGSPGARELARVDFRGSASRLAAWRITLCLPCRAALRLGAPGLGHSRLRPVTS